MPLLCHFRTRPFDAILANRPFTSCSSLRHHQLVQLQKLPQDRIVALLHLLHRPEKVCLSGIEKDDPVGKTLGETHVMRDYDAREMKLLLESFDQVTEQ